MLVSCFRVLRLVLRVHGGSGPVAGDYSMSARAADVAAVLDALAPLGVTHIDMPATPERVWHAIQGAGRA